MEEAADPEILVFDISEVQDVQDDMKKHKMCPQWRRKSHQWRSPQDLQLLFEEFQQIYAGDKPTNQLPPTNHV